MCDKVIILFISFVHQLFRCPIVTKQHNVIMWMKLTQVTTLLRAPQQQDVWKMGKGELGCISY